MWDVPFPRLTYVTCLYKPYTISVRKASFEANSSGCKCKAKLVVSFSFSGHWEPTTASWWAVSNVLQLPQVTEDCRSGQSAGCVRSPNKLLKCSHRELIFNLGTTVCLQATEEMWQIETSFGAGQQLSLPEPMVGRVPHLAWINYILPSTCIFLQHQPL